jgi:peptide deformylase
MELVYYPEEILARPCAPVKDFDDSLTSIVSQMTRLMYESRGVGLAAPQVGLDMRLVIIDQSLGSDRNSHMTMVNPKVVWASKNAIAFSEGCLSIPNVKVSVTRPESVEVEYQDVEGNTCRSSLGGWEARIAQHEIDHINGLVMLSHISDPRASQMILACYKTPKKTVVRTRT